MKNILLFSIASLFMLFGAFVYADPEITIHNEYGADLTFVINIGAEYAPDFQQTMVLHAGESISSRVLNSGYECIGGNNSPSTYIQVYTPKGPFPSYFAFGLGCKNKNVIDISGYQVSKTVAYYWKDLIENSQIVFVKSKS
jgi:hypothetical protein